MYKSVLVCKQVFVEIVGTKLIAVEILQRQPAVKVALTKTWIGVGVFHSVSNLQGTLYIACSCLGSATGDACCAILTERSALVGLVLTRGAQVIEDISIFICPMLYNGTFAMHLSDWL